MKTLLVSMLTGMIVLVPVTEALGANHALYSALQHQRRAAVRAQQNAALIAREQRKTYDALAARRAAANSKAAGIGVAGSLKNTKSRVIPEGEKLPGEDQWPNFRRGANKWDQPED